MQYKLLTLTSRDAAPESHQVRPESLKTLERGGGGATSHTFSQMKSKRCSHNLQSDKQGPCQRICVLIMRITSKPQINGLEKEQKHGGRRRDCFSV